MYDTLKVYGEENRRKIHEQPSDSDTVWCALWSDDVINIFF